MAFDSRDELQVFGGAAALELGGLAAGERVIDARLRENFEREVGDRGWHLHFGLGRRGMRGHESLLGLEHSGAELGFLATFFVGLIQADERRRDFAMVGQESVLVLVAEHRRHREVVFLRDRVVFMVVAAGALHRQAHETVAGGHHAVVDAVLAKLLGDRAALEGHAVDAVEGRRHALALGRAREEVAGELFGQELIVRLIVVESLQYPIAPRPSEHRLISRVAPGVGVAGEIEPTDGEVLTKTRRGQQGIDPLLVGVG